MLHYTCHPDVILEIPKPYIGVTKLKGMACICNKCGKTAAKLVVTTGYRVHVSCQECITKDMRKLNRNQQVTYDEE